MAIEFSPGRRDFFRKSLLALGGLALAGCTDESPLNPDGSADPAADPTQTPGLVQESDGELPTTVVETGSNLDPTIQFLYPNETGAPLVEATRNVEYLKSAQSFLETNPALSNQGYDANSLSELSVLEIVRGENQPSTAFIFLPDPENADFVWLLGQTSATIQNGQIETTNDEKNQLLYIDSEENVRSGSDNNLLFEFKDGHYVIDGVSVEKSFLGKLNLSNPKGIEAGAVALGYEPGTETLMGRYVAYDKNGKPFLDFNQEQWAWETYVERLPDFPDEWKDLVEPAWQTMVDKNGVKRKVAILKSDVEGEAGTFRVLQFNEKPGEPGVGEWVAYVPDVGKISSYAGWWDEMTIDELPGDEIKQRMNQEHVYGKDGQEIMPGLVGDFRDVTLFCGDIVDHSFTEVSVGKNTNIVVAVPLGTGDIVLFYVDGDSPNSPSLLTKAVYKMEDIDPTGFDKKREELGDGYLQDAIGRFPQSASAQQYWSYLTKVAVESATSARRIVFGVQKTDTMLNGGDSPDERKAFAGKFQEGVVVDTEHIKVIINNYIIASESDYNEIISS